MKAKNIVLTDGGMGQELVHRSSAPPSPMWGAQVLMDHPYLVCELHAEYIRAGARVITVNAYSVTPERLAVVNAEAQFEKLQRRALDLALKARDIAGVADVAIAGCLPPLFGSYQPDTFPGAEPALNTYRRIVEAQSSEVDVFLCETMSSVKESVASVTASSESGTPVWLALSVDDNGNGLLRSGETIASAFAAVETLKPQAVLLNCSIPEAVTAAWDSLEGLPCATGAYANGFTSILDLEIGGTVDKLQARTDLGPAEYASYAMDWVSKGADIVGGCCEISPAHIQKLSESLSNSGYEINARLI
jgi:S-methylmethionine-dependent homocysteine/selenocysteine methylase